MIDCTTGQRFKFNGTVLLVHCTQYEQVKAAIESTGHHVTWESVVSALHVSCGEPEQVLREWDFENPSIWHAHAEDIESAREIEAALDLG